MPSRWTVTDQIGHLTYFDTAAALAFDDPEAFVAHRGVLVSNFADELAVDEFTLGAFRQLSPTEQLAAWRAHRTELETAGRTLAISAAAVSMAPLGVPVVPEVGTTRAISSAICSPTRKAAVRRSLSCRSPDGIGTTGPSRPSRTPSSAVISDSAQGLGGMARARRVIPIS